jgi:tRNA A-37 threonylcarbamoyl transferase component Bud32
MAHMHSKGVVDQDFHAGNVLLSQDGQTLIKTDLGSAAWTETDGQPTFLDRCW